MKLVRCLALGVLLTGCADDHPPASHDPTIPEQNAALEEAAVMAISELCARADACYPQTSAAGDCSVPISQSNQVTLFSSDFVSPGDCERQAQAEHPEAYNRVLSCAYDTLRDAEIALREGCPAAFPELVPGVAPCWEPILEDFEMLEEAREACMAGE